MTCRSPRGVAERVEGRFGTVALHRPQATPRALVFLFSDTAGWTPSLSRDAQALAAEGAIVVGVDLRRYLRNLAASDDQCHYLISEVEDLSKRLQREAGAHGYRSPILAGMGAGGALAYAALAQAPAATVAGAIAVDPTAAVPTRVPLCPGAASSADPEGGFRYAMRADLAGWWRSSPAEGEAAPQTPTPSADERLLHLVRAALPPPAEAAAGSLDDLPLVELPATRPGEALAVIYSGDGGWRDIDKQIGEALAASGVAVVGVDSLRYFWTEKPPDRVARDLGRILGHYAEEWQRPDVALIGYSFGAGILPFAYNRLPEDERARVRLIALLGIEHHAPFEFDVGGWLGSTSEDALATLPEAQRLPLERLQCFYGEEEEDTLCTEPTLAAAEIVRTEGGHHFDGDYEALAARIADGLRRRVSGSAPPAVPPRPGPRGSPGPAVG